MRTVKAGKQPGEVDLAERDVLEDRARGRFGGSGDVGACLRDDAGAIRPAIGEVLSGPAYHHVAARVAAELAAMPMLDEVVEQLVQRSHPNA
jgi:hypothetical protein